MEICGCVLYHLVPSTLVALRVALLGSENLIIFQSALSDRLPHRWKLPMVLDYREFPFRESEEGMDRTFPGFQLLFQRPTFVP